MFNVVLVLLGGGGGRWGYGGSFCKKMLEVVSLCLVYSARPRVDLLLARAEAIGSRMFPGNTYVIMYLRKGKKIGKKKKV